MKKANLNNYRCKLNYPSDYINICLQRRYNLYMHLYKHVEVIQILAQLKNQKHVLKVAVF